MQGKFIVFEGIEGCGKTTQLVRSHQWLLKSGWLSTLQSKDFVKGVVLTREPGGPTLGVGIRQLLLSPSEEPVQDRTEMI
jgi:dTMP kinase